MRTLRIYSPNFAVYDTAVLPIVIVLYITALIVAVCVLSRVGLFETPQTVAHQAPVHGISQARILEWAVISSSRGFS